MSFLCPRWEKTLRPTLGQGLHSSHYCKAQTAATKAFPHLIYTHGFWKVDARSRNSRKLELNINKKKTPNEKKKVIQTSKSYSTCPELIPFFSFKYTCCCNAQDNHSCKLWLVYHHPGSVPLHCFSPRQRHNTAKSHKRNSFGSSGYCLDVSFSQLWCLMLILGLLFLLNYSWDETQGPPLFPCSRDGATQTAVSLWPYICIMPLWPYIHRPTHSSSFSADSGQRVQLLSIIGNSQRGLF